MNTAGWLGIDAATNPVWGGYGPTGTTIYDTDNEELETPENQFAEGKNISIDELANESKSAMEVAEKGMAEPAKETAFMPLGVFTLAPENQTESTAIIQLAIAKDGTVRGTYHDLLANTAIPIHGSVNKKAQRVAWRIGPQGKVAFQTALAVLTEPSGPVALHYANGQTRQWVLARYEKEPSPNDPEDADAQGQRQAT